MTADGEQALLAAVQARYRRRGARIRGQARDLPAAGLGHSSASRAEFLAELKRKAGLPIDFWSSAVHVSRYGVTKWRESDLRPMEETS
mgnify:CR=1 FL=1